MTSRQYGAGDRGGSWTWRGDYHLQSRINLIVPGLDKALALEIAHAADAICPYSKATRGNIDVDPSVTTYQRVKLTPVARRLATRGPSHRTRPVAKKAEAARTHHPGWLPEMIS
ncbi:hypothetical protein [Massilia polaris]|uniref:hypothetical protein n=1 Tax=Massilia polaris TaxID=2728846 RepID=UPI002805B444|nr:hypothetical protein [Massilia polaris]